MARARTELVHCDNCGEDYAATYRRCPFCNAKAGQRFDDYDAPEGGEGDAPRRGGKRLAGGAPPSGGGGDPARIAIYILAALVIVVVICVLISVVIPKLVAPAPAESAAPTDAAAPSETAAVQSAAAATAEAPATAGADDPAMSFHPLPVVDGMEGDDPLSLDSPDLPTVGPDVVSDPAASATPAATPAPTPAASPSTGGLRLSSTDFTLSPRYPTYQLECGLGHALVTYSVKNEAVATVSSTGLVTAVGDGNTTITVTDQSGNAATAIVRVSGISGQSGGAGEASASQTPASETPAGDARLTYGGRTITEFSITARHPEPITLKVQGGEAAAWRVKTESVAAVSENGTITGVGNGSTTVECTLTDGTVLRCTVHVDGL